MYREIPILNGILSKKWNSYEQQLHLKKLRETKGLVAVVPPRKFKHFQSKLKKEQLQEDRFTEIERENRILLEKMTVIMNKEGTLGGPSPKWRNQPPIVSPFTKRSLNFGYRKKQSERVKSENKAFLRRLQDRTSAYNVEKWETEHKQRNQLLSNVCKYKYILRDEARRSINSSVIRSRDGSEILPPSRNFRRMKNDPDYRAGVTQSLDFKNILPPVDRSVLRNPRRTAVPSSSPRIPESLKYSPRLMTSPLNRGQIRSQESMRGRMQLTSPQPPSQFDISKTPHDPFKLDTPLNSEMGFRWKRSASPNRDIISPLQPPHSFLKPLNVKALQIFQPYNLKRIVLFRAEHQIDHRNFLIEISRTQKQGVENNRKMFILALDLEIMSSNKQLLIELTERQGRSEMNRLAKKLMNESDHDFQNVLNRLYLKYGKVLSIREIPTHFYKYQSAGTVDANPDEIEDIKELEAAMTNEHADMEMEDKDDKHRRSPPQLPVLSHSSGEQEPLAARRSASPPSHNPSPSHHEHQIILFNAKSTTPEMQKDTEPPEPIEQGEERQEEREEL